MSTRIPRIQRISEFELECGAVLCGVRQAYFLDGELNAARDNMVLVFHALTGNADAVGDWWSDIVGPGKAVDTRRYAVLSTNLLGSCCGTTYDSAVSGAGVPPITTRDQARLVHRLVRELGARSVALAVGGSLGGMVTLEWVATFPQLTRTAVVLAAPAAHTASAIAWSHIQRRIIAAAGEEGLEIARMVAMMTYRTADELEQRFGRRRENDGFAVESYLSHHGVKLRDRFDIRSYLTLLDAMDSHDVGRGRGGIGAALSSAGTRIIGVGIPGDLLYSDRDVQGWVNPAGADYAEIRSVRGHDAFLLEPAQVATILRRALAARPAQITSTCGAS